MKSEEDDDRDATVATAHLGGGACRPLHFLVTVAFLGLAGAAGLVRSASPTVLDRYSRAWFLYHIVNIAIACLLFMPTRRVGFAGRQMGYALVIVSTFLAPGNDAVRCWPGVLALLPAVRLLAGVAMIAAEFDAYRAGRRTGRGILLGVGAMFTVLSVVDLGLYVRVAATSGFAPDFQGYRDRYALEQVTANDIVLVGDSFVWGHGVRKEERFGDVLEGLYARTGRRVKVYSLGRRGAGPEQHLESLEGVPAGRTAGIVIVAFYPNDLAPRPAPQGRLPHLVQAVTWPMSQSSLAFRAVHDLLGKLETPSVAGYHQSVIADYRRTDPTFRRRWAALVDALDRCAQRARRLARARPLLVILPLVVDYREYPLQQAHADLAQAAARLGYDVFDLLPAFRAELGDGDRFRVSPRDNHFDARVHALVARLLKSRLDSRSDTAQLGSDRFGP